MSNDPTEAYEILRRDLEAQDLGFSGDRELLKVELIADESKYPSCAAVCERGEPVSKIAFTVPCVPVAQPRARATSFNGHARMYEAAKSHPIHAFKASVRLAWSQAHQGPALDCPVRLSAVFVFPRPQSLVWKKRPMPRCPAPSKRCGDFDNLGKGLADALNGLAWADDSQIVVATVIKEYAAGGEQPHVSIVIEPLES